MEHLPISSLAAFGSTPFTEDALRELAGDYDALPMKLSRMVARGDIIRLKRGLYCVAAKHIKTGTFIQTGVIANRLYGPSYISFETALRLYGLIPEMVFLQLSAVTGPSREYHTPVADFSYVHVPESVFHLGLRVERTNNGCYTVANPTKALCDTIMRKRNLRVTSPKALRDFLEVDMRFDFDEFGEPDLETLRGFAECGIKSALFKALERIFI